MRALVVLAGSLLVLLVTGTAVWMAAYIGWGPFALRRTGVVRR